uniref:Uncharacterized protein n=1 Tax=Equus caballus TaxID=9796 RepID=A0A9L0RB92_HORSE
IFSSKRLIVSGLIFRSLIHFEFILVCGEKEWSIFNLLHVAVQFSQHHLLKRLSFLHCRPETISLLQENIGSTLFDISFKRIFSDTITPQLRETIERINKWDFIRLKSFFKARENRIETKKQLTKWEKIFTSHLSDKGLISIIYKELTLLNNKKTNNPIKKLAEDMNRHFSKEDMNMANRHMKRCSSSLI